MRKLVFILGVLFVFLLMVLPSLGKAPESLAMEPDKLEGAPPIFMPHVIFDPLLTFMNGDFESGSAYWIPDLPTGATRPLIYEAGDLPIPPFQGDWMAWIKSEGIEGNYMLTQRVTIPTDATHLSFWHWDDFGTSCGGNDGVLLQICGQIIYLTQCYSQWLNLKYDVSSCAGQTLDLRIGLSTEGVGYLESTFLDQIEFVTIP